MCVNLENILLSEISHSLCSQSSFWSHFRRRELDWYITDKGFSQNVEFSNMDQIWPNDDVLMANSQPSDDRSSNTESPPPVCQEPSPSPATRPPQFCIPIVIYERDKLCAQLLLVDHRPATDPSHSLARNLWCGRVEFCREWSKWPIRRVCCGGKSFGKLCSQITDFSQEKFLTEKKWTWDQPVGRACHSLRHSVRNVCLSLKTGDISMEPLLRF